MLNSFEANNSNLSAMHRTQGSIGHTFHITFMILKTVNILRFNLSLLGLFLRLNAPRFDNNFDQETLLRKKNRRKTEERMPQGNSESS